MYAIENSETPMMFVVEYGDKEGIDIHDMIVRQNYVVGKDIEDTDDFGGGTWRELGNTTEYIYNDGEYVAYTKAITTENKVFMINLIGYNTNDYEKYVKELLESFSLSEKKVELASSNISLEDYINDKTENTEDNQYNNSRVIMVSTIKSVKTKSEINIFDYSTDKISGKSIVILPDNTKRVVVNQSYSEIEASNNLFVFIDVYNYTGKQKNKTELIESDTAELDEMLNGDYTTDEIDNNTFIIKFKTDYYEETDIYKFDNEKCTTYRVSYDYTDENSVKAADKYIESIKVNNNTI
jgi:hypothetical protein